MSFYDVSDVYMCNNLDYFQGLYNCVSDECDMGKTRMPNCIMMYSTHIHVLYA